MSVFQDNRNKQAAQTLKNRSKMYDQSRPSEVNGDGVKSNSKDAYNFLGKKSQLPPTKTEAKKD